MGKACTNLLALLFTSPFSPTPSPSSALWGSFSSRLLVARRLASLRRQIGPSICHAHLVETTVSRFQNPLGGRPAVERTGGGLPDIQSLASRLPQPDQASGRDSRFRAQKILSLQHISPQSHHQEKPRAAAAVAAPPSSFHRPPFHQDSSTATPSPLHPPRVQLDVSNMSQRDTSTSGAGNNSNNSHSRQPTSYPSPHSYPSPSAAGAYQYPPPSHTANIEPYRASPTASSAQLPSLNLPPIRIMDQHQNPQQVAQLQQQSAQAQMGSPLPPPVAPMGTAYYNPNLPPQQGNPNITSSPLNQSMRYPIPNDGRIMSGGRHKKEIKRRTKTGCLTCRKRRIKVSSIRSLTSNRPRRKSTSSRHRESPNLQLRSLH